MITELDILNDSSPLSHPGRAKLLVRIAIPVAAGSGAGAPVVTAVSCAGLSLPAGGSLPGLPSAYAAMATPDQPALVSVSGKTSSGFNVTLTPLAGATINAGFVDLVVIG